MGVKFGLLPLREEYWLRAFETGVLWRIFELVRENVTGGWRKLYNEEFYNLYFSPVVIIGVIVRWAWHIVCMGRK
jgi:hypothetical protein